MRLAVASGKGGTGKTSVACALALALDRPLTFLDCDVEGANAHIFLQPNFTSHEDVTIPFPTVDASKCDACGMCQENCQFGAMMRLGKRMRIMQNLCHGCGVCHLVCPKDAVVMNNRKVGRVNYGNALLMRFACGELLTGEALSVPIIRKLKETRDDLMIIDCPPGTSCPAVESLSGVDYALLVTEPTPFGEHDLKAMIEVCRRMKVPCGVIINRSVGDDRNIERLCSDMVVPVLMRIPFDRKVAECYAKGGTLLTAMPGIEQDLLDLFLKTMGERS